MRVLVFVFLNGTLVATIEAEEVQVSRGADEDGREKRGGRKSIGCKSGKCR